MSSPLPDKLKDKMKNAIAVIVLLFSVGVCHAYDFKVVSHKLNTDTSGTMYSVKIGTKYVTMGTVTGISYVVSADFGRGTPRKYRGEIKGLSNNPTTLTATQIKTLIKNDIVASGIKARADAECAKRIGTYDSKFPTINGSVVTP